MSPPADERSFGHVRDQMASGMVRDNGLGSTVFSDPEGSPTIVMELNRYRSLEVRFLSGAGVRGDGTGTRNTFDGLVEASGVD